MSDQPAPTPPATDEMLAGLDRLREMTTPHKLRKHITDARVMDDNGTVADFEIGSSRRTRQEMAANALEYVALRNAYPALRSRLAEAEAKVEKLDRDLHYIQNEGWNCQAKLEFTVTQACDALGILHHEHHKIVATIERLTREREEAKAEIDRCHAFIDRLPRTADGKPMIPGMEVFHNVFSISSDGCEVVASWFTSEQGELWVKTKRGYMNFQPHELFSTRDAALASKTEGQP